MTSRVAVGALRTMAKTAPQQKPLESPTDPTLPFVDARSHYEELRHFFHLLLGWVLGALTLLGLAAGFLFFQSMREIKEAAKGSIQDTQTAAQKKMEAIRDEAPALIESSIRKQVGDALEKKIASEVERYSVNVREDIRRVGRIADMAIRIRVGGYLKGLQELDEARTAEPNQTALLFASELFDKIAKDYDEAFGELNRKPDTLKPDYSRTFLDIPAEVSEQEIPARLAAKILAADNLNEVATGFILLRRVTGVQFKMFDFAAVKKWQKENSVPVPTPK